MSVLETLWRNDPDVARILAGEARRQRDGLELIASENYVSRAVLEAQGSVLTNKYAEGYPGNRYYGGCEYVDLAENLARERAKELFGAAYANVQPHSGTQANMAVYFTFLKPGDTVLGMDLSHGGHLTHGSPVNFSGQLYRFVGLWHRSEDRSDRLRPGRRRSRERERPKMITVGASAYSRAIDFARFRQIADAVGAFLFADIAHPAGLIAKGLLPSPLPHAHVVTTTTHKTLRGPRGGLILLGQDFENPFGQKAAKSGRTLMMSELLDKMVIPGIQGGPLMPRARPAPLEHRDRAARIRRRCACRGTRPRRSRSRQAGRTLRIPSSSSPASTRSACRQACSTRMRSPPAGSSRAHSPGAARSSTITRTTLMSPKRRFKHRGWNLFSRGEATENRELIAGRDAPAYRVGKLSLGAVRDFRIADQLAIGAGGLVAVNFVPPPLRPLYGGSNPTGAMGFVRLKLG